MKSLVGTKQRKITFCSLPGIGIPLPDRRYLALHASFAHTFFQSGVERYLLELEVKSLQGLVDVSSSIDFGDEEEEEGDKKEALTEKRRKKTRGRKGKGGHRV
jgi:hypothetical protein